MYPIKGCGAAVTFTKACGVERHYCNECLRARVEHLEQRELTLAATHYETPTLSIADIEANFKAVARNWSRTCNSTSQQG